MVFKTRTFFFEPLNREVTIFMQNENGPCMLLAVLNALSLKGRLKVSPGTYDADTLIAFIMEICPEAGDLTHLLRGCDIIPCFSSCRDFKDYPNFLSSLNLTLLHAMVPDPESSIFELVITEDYDSLVLKLTDDHIDALVRVELENWWDQIQQQVTKIGLSVVDAAMQNGDIVIFFRSNHFSVLFKTMSRVFSLVTDHGFIGTNCFWETVPDEFGESKFFNERFILSTLKDSPRGTNSAHQITVPPTNQRSPSTKPAQAVSRPREPPRVRYQTVHRAPPPDDCCSVM